MSETDAVRPTSETGESVMWKCDKCGHETPTGVEHFCAPRPLPDFPAGAAGLEILVCEKRNGCKWTGLVCGWDAESVKYYVERHADNCDGALEPTSDEVTPGLSELERLRAENESMRDFIARNCIDSDFPEPAPARPAAAGLTLTDVERSSTQALVMGHAYLPDARDPQYEAWIIEKTLDHVAVILSSRATGAEVEIPTWTDDDFCKSLCEHMGSLSLEGYDPIHRRGMRYGFAAGIKWAREQYAHRQVEIVIEEPSGDWISNQCSASIKEAAVDPNGGNDVYRFYRRVLDYARRHATIRGKP